MSRSSSSTLVFLLFSAAALFLSSSVDAFTTQPGRTMEGARSTKAVASKRMLESILKMADGEQDNKISADGTFYDDEVNTEPIKAGISEGMKAKLMKEASSGLDSEAKQTNVILYIGVVVVALVALAGGGILF